MTILDDLNRLDELIEMTQKDALDIKHICKDYNAAVKFSEVSIVKELQMVRDFLSKIKSKVLEAVS